MCLILDVNIVPKVFTESEFKSVRVALKSKKTFLVIGGKLFDEYIKHNKSMRMIDEYKRSKILEYVRTDDDRVKRETDALETQGGYVSDDPHILALARISGARILLTGDQDLIQDFGNKDLINNPRGKVFDRADHSHLLWDESLRCPGARRQAE